MCLSYFLCKCIHIPESMFYSSLEHSSKKEKLVLNLSTNSLTAKTCAILSKVIAADHAFVEYKFADCMLSEDGKSVFL